MAAARAIAAAAAPLETAFIEAGHAPEFLAEIAALLAAFEAATAQKHQGKISQVASTAMLKEQARLGIVAATKLDAFARNHYRDQPEMLAGWQHARHIERSPRQAEPSAGAGTAAPVGPTASPAPAAPAAPAPTTGDPHPRTEPATLANFSDSSHTTASHPDA